MKWGLSKVVLLFFLGTFLFSCASMKSPVVTEPEKVANIDSAYIVNTESSSDLMESTVQSSLTKMGISAYSGSLKDKSSDTDVYIECSDEWFWDIVTYLKRFRINVYDTRTDEMLASVEYDNSGVFHTYPDTEEKIDEAVKSIFQSDPDVNSY